MGIDSVTYGGVLFDLDGTLADTALDFELALNSLLTEVSREPVSIQRIRRTVSSGSLGLVKLGFGELDDATLEEHRQRLLDFYENNLCVRTRLFEGVSALLDKLDRNSIPWGIMTNKPERFALPLLKQLGLFDRAGCVICGDTTDECKPHPLPLLLSANKINIVPEQCLYVGDDVRDMQAAKAAGMRSVLAGYGYAYDSPEYASWNPDIIVDDPLDIMKYLK